MSKSSENSCCCRIEFVFAALILRLWVGMRLFFAGLDKFRQSKYDDSPGADNFGMDHLSENMGKITKGIKDGTPLPDWAVDIFGMVLPWALVGIGGMIILGLARKLSLAAGGMLFIGLGVGLAFLPDDLNLVSNIGISVAIVGFALVVSAHDKISIDGIVGLATGGSKKSED